MKILEAFEKIEEKFKSGEYQEKLKKRIETEGEEPWIMLLDEFEIEPFILEGYYRAPYYSLGPVKTKITFKKVEVLYKDGDYIIQVVCLEPVLSIVKIYWEKTPAYGWEFYEFKRHLEILNKSR